MNVEFVEMSDPFLNDAAEIYNHYVRNTTVTFHTEEMTGEEMKDILYQHDTLYVSYAILNDGKFVGYAYMAPYKKRQAYRVSSEVTLYIKPECCAKGIGSHALTLLEANAKKKGIRTLLAVVCSENAASIKLFLKNGYEKSAHLKEVGMKFNRLLDIVILQKIMN